MANPMNMRTTVTHLKERKRVVTIAYRIVSDSTLEYAATIFRIGNDKWNKSRRQGHNKTTAHRLTYFPVSLELSPALKKQLATVNILSTSTNRDEFQKASTNFHKDMVAWIRRATYTYGVELVTPERRQAVNRTVVKKEPVKPQETPVKVEKPKSAKMVATMTKKFGSSINNYPAGVFVST